MNINTVTQGHLVKRAILDQIITKARNLVQTPNNIYNQFKNLLDPIEAWRHGHYRNLACMLDMSINTLKYYIQEGDHLKQNNRKKILDFLEHPSNKWEDLEQEAIFKLLAKKLSA